MTGQYVNPCINVSEIVKGVLPDEEDMVTAAILHDVIEDTGYTYFTIVDKFGFTIVDLLTNVSDGQGNRKERKELDLIRLSACSVKAKIIKIADLINNTSSSDPKFPHREKEALLFRALTIRMPATEKEYELAYRILWGHAFDTVQE